ncbi:hypothetical protein NOS3756_56530 (plasmid) [Nostoc sp. NIES-3756]|uniref:hypothetical protein n=1 Tax=Nostoc sp. NIES-3756 TaxID=1751286 RepID=UPI0007218C87|nr:hypothetical protein [Nostoc sp. NIES-3756]BAT56641.1 hypothetical protein NOS3756_56530 [Nostoc sp. NIES-3756]BAY41692.1 hypothetical protein NIES2111_60880 [Nostoc sp. NIES-2111]
MKQLKGANLLTKIIPAKNNNDIERGLDDDAEPCVLLCPLSELELAHFESLGLQPVEKIIFQESERFNIKQVRIEYQRSSLV